MVRTAQTLYLRLGISHATLGNKECSSHYINCLPIDNWPPHHWFTSLPPPLPGHTTLQVVLNKPSGLQVMPAGVQCQRTVLTLLTHAYSPSIDANTPASANSNISSINHTADTAGAQHSRDLLRKQESNSKHPEPSVPAAVHRLGRGTSGLLICAISDLARRALGQLMQHATSVVAADTEAPTVPVSAQGANVPAAADVGLQAGAESQPAATRSIHKDGCILITHEQLGPLPFPQPCTTAADSAAAAGACLSADGGVAAAAGSCPADAEMHVESYHLEIGHEASVLLSPAGVDVATGVATLATVCRDGCGSDCGCMLLPAGHVTPSVPPGVVRKLYRTRVQGLVSEPRGQVNVPIGLLPHPGVAEGVWAACSSMNDELERGMQDRQGDRDGDGATWSLTHGQVSGSTRGGDDDAAPQGGGAAARHGSQDCGEQETHVRRSRSQRPKPSCSWWHVVHRDVATNTTLVDVSGTGSIITIFTLPAQGNDDITRGC